VLRGAGGKPAWGIAPKIAESPERPSLSGGVWGLSPRLLSTPLSCRRGAGGEVSAHVMGLKTVFSSFVVLLVNSNVNDLDAETLFYCPART